MPSAELCLQKMLKKQQLSCIFRRCPSVWLWSQKRRELESQLCQYTYQEPLGQFLITCVPLFSPSAK